MCIDAHVIADPGQHESVDLWLLLLLAGLGGKRCEAVHKLLKKKFTEGHVDNSWLDRGTVGHQVCSAPSLTHLASVAWSPGPPGLLVGHQLHSQQPPCKVWRGMAASSPCIHLICWHCATRMSDGLYKANRMCNKSSKPGLLQACCMTY